jgi:transposase-like protein
MDKPALFKWRHFTWEIIVCGVRWYLRDALSYRDVEALLRERGVSVDHTTVFRWVQRYTPELDKGCRVNETYSKIKKQWSYLYRAVDATSQTMDFLLRKTRDATAAERFFRKALRATHTATPRVVTVDKTAAYPPAFATLRQDGQLPANCTLRQCKYLNNVIEQEHRFLKRRINPGVSFGSFRTAQQPLKGYEAMHMIRKEQLQGVPKGDILAQNRVIAEVFGVAA